MNQDLLQIIGFTITFIVSLYFYWEEFSHKFKHGDFKYKNGMPVLPEHVLDVWFFSGALSLLFARASYVLLNLSQFPNKWEWTPWIRSAEGDFIWLSRFPWVFINFLGGLDISVYVFAMFILPVIFAFKLGFGLKDWFRPFKKSLMAIIVGTQIGGIFLPIEGLSKATIFNAKSISVYADENLYFLVGVGISALYLLVSALILTKDKSRKLRVLVFSAYLSIYLLLTKLTQQYDVRWLYFVPVPVLFGLIGFLFTKDEPTEEQISDISKTRLLRTHADVEIAVKGISRKKSLKGAAKSNNQ